jgi:hypothetical protein
MFDFRFEGDDVRGSSNRKSKIKHQKSSSPFAARRARFGRAAPAVPAFSPNFPAAQCLPSSFAD